MDKLGRYFLKRPQALLVLVLAGLLGLPVAVWLDLQNLSDQNLERQARSVNMLISVVRSYYAKNVVGRILSTDGKTVPLHNYAQVEGAVPIPATLSIELSDAISAQQGNMSYHFVSDYPFANRPAHELSTFEQDSLRKFRDGGTDQSLLIEHLGNLWDQQVTLAAPVIMGASCVACHNSHPESLKTDWKVGDVRGIQTVSVFQPLSFNIWSFKWLLSYLAIAGSAGFVLSFLQFRLATSFSRMNDELEANNTFLAGISMKLSKYLSPQVYKSIFSGEKDVEISTERKKLTVFFSDIKDFTETTENLQPEELTALLNEYFTEMSRIAERHGATIDKFIGDAIVAFFGDPETRGAKGDAEACVLMALDMQARLSELEDDWRARGLEQPFQARMGINTGYCNVGNFGSSDRMDYTIIGAEANLAARMEGIAEPGGIVMSFETYSLVRDLVSADPMDPVSFKGIARKIIPYRVKRPDTDPVADMFEQSRDGRRLTVPLDRLDEVARERLIETLREVLSANPKNSTPKS